MRNDAPRYLRYQWESADFRITTICNNPQGQNNLQVVFLYKQYVPLLYKSFVSLQLKCRLLLIDGVVTGAVASQTNTSS